MGQNINKGAGTNAFTVFARPDEQNAIIDRQGQFARILKAQICPCNTDGHGDLYCKICWGKGFIYSRQRYIDVYEENAPHNRIHPNVIQTYFQPITKAYHARALAPPDAAEFLPYDELKIKSYSEKEIYIETKNKQPNEMQAVVVAYQYEHWDKVTIKVNGNGTHFINIKDKLRLRDVTKISNVFDYYNDIVAILSSPLPIKNFYKQSIVLDEIATPVAPTVNDVLTFEMYVAKPFTVAVRDITEQELRSDTTLSELSSGDVTVVTPSNLDFGEGDIVTLLSTLMRRSELKIRSNADREELTEFDIDKIIGFIIDANQAKYYYGEHFVLDDFNFIRWITPTRPAQGVKYSVQYEYYPSYIAFKPQMPKFTGHENKRWPKTFMMKKYTRLILKQEPDIFTDVKLTTPNASDNYQSKLDDL